MEKQKPIPEKKASFALYLAQGKTQILAFQLSHPNSEATLESQYEMASKLAKDPEVVERVAELAKSYTVGDIDTVGQHYLRILDDRQEAKDAGNMTAVAALDRLLAQCQGMTNEKFTLTPAAKMTDEELARSIAGDDEQVYQIIRRRIGNDGFGEWDGEEG